MTVRGPRLASSGSGVSRGGSPNSDTTAQPTMTAARPPRSRPWRRRTASARSGVRSSEEMAANPEASSSPTGVAMVNPALRPYSSTCGVARACRSRNPAEDRNTSETRNRRASARWRDTSLIRTPRATLTAATPTTSPKWMAWCSRTTSKWGWATSSHSPSRGRTRWKPQTATRRDARRGMAAAMSVVRFAAAPGHLGEGVPVELLAGDHRDPARGHGPQGGRAPAPLEQGHLADHGPGAELGHRLAVDLDHQHAVEEQVHVGAGLALLDQDLAVLEPPEVGLAVDDGHRQPALQGRLGRHHQGRRVLVAPGGSLHLGLAEPAGEVDPARLGDQLAVVVVDPVPREGARPDDLVGRPAVGVDGQGQGRPGGRGDHLDERRAADAPRRRGAGPAPGRLHEPDPAVAQLGPGPHVRERRGREGQVARAEAQGGGADVAVAGVAVVDDAAVLDLDPGPQLVGEPEAVGLLEGLEVLQDVGRWRVVVGDAEAERQLGPGAFHRPERNPRQRGDRRLNAHAELLFVPPGILPGALARRQGVADSVASRHGGIPPVQGWPVGVGRAVRVDRAGHGRGVLYTGMSWPRLWLRFLTPASWVFTLLFLLASPASAPNFARLADQSTWYRNATGVSGFTPWAMPAMLTGRSQ